MVNIGMGPTFGGKLRKIELHILGFSTEIYGKDISVEFIKRRRGEKAFSDKEALVRQIKEDRENVKKILEDVEPR